MAAVQNAGLALDWVRRVLSASWDELYASAARVTPGAAGLTFLPYLTRESTHQQHAHSHGAFLGMRIDHQREHLLHAALEEVAFGIRAALEALPGASEATNLRLTGAHLGVTIFFRENPTLRSETPSQAVPSTSLDER
jgi:xylulokinase